MHNQRPPPPTLGVGCRPRSLYSSHVGLVQERATPPWAEMLYELERGLREEGWPSEEFVYDAEHDLYRFPDGEFAFSREYANERRLQDEGFIG